MCLRNGAYGAYGYGGCKGYRGYDIDIEDTEHFLLLCPYFGVQRIDFHAGIYTPVRPYGYANVPNDLLLHGDKNFPGIFQEFVDLRRSFVQDLTCNN